MKMKMSPRKVQVKLYFDDLFLNEAFKNTLGRGAVYVKTRVKGDTAEYMMELSTGKLFEPTFSPVERVDVEYKVYH